MFVLFNHDYQEEREQLNEFKTLATGLNRRAKSIIQLKPRNPTHSIKGKLPIQAVCDFKQQEVRATCSQSIVMCDNSQSGCARRRASARPPLTCIFINHGLCFRSPFTKAMSAHSSTTLSPSSGRSWTALDTRQWCPPSASWCLRSTRRPWTAWPGENPNPNSETEQGFL